MMRAKAGSLALAMALLLAGCGAATDKAEPTEADAAVAPAVPDVPAAFVGTWTSDGCDNPSVRIGVNDIRHFYTDVPSPLTAVTPGDDGRLVLAWVDEGKAITDTFQLTDGQLNHVSSVSADVNEDYAADPMTRCSGLTQLD
ncbi:hypothetical protein [Brevundimonas aurifodinae]|uniref:Lipoprotein n=2 Tax=Brevundimonas TaxID=41275 RepID=A0ABV1NQ68_9CAUL|nr:MAG: hypothetical protein B7Z42_10545 [Brevundimonas sp. 12-68-7]OYX32996.1 MAG: hypothetical protein B7Z01_10210 [Brevundimonas subvibrioides]